MSTNTKWTLRDQADLEELQRRKDEFFEKNRRPVIDVAAKIICGRHTDEFTVADKMIEHAEAIRDALAPFDSGTRAVEEKAS